MPIHVALTGVSWKKLPFRYSSYSSCESASVDGDHRRIKLPQLSFWSSTVRFVGAVGGVESPFPASVTVCELLTPETLPAKSRARTWNVCVPGEILRSNVDGVPMYGCATEDTTAPSISTS